MYSNNYSKIPDILTRKEAQSILKIGKGTMFRLIHNGELPAIRLGNNRFKIKKEDLITYIENNVYVG